MAIDGNERQVLVDSGCSCSVIFAPLCESWVRDHVSLVTVSGERSVCEGKGRVRVDVAGKSVVVKVLVVSYKPMGVDLILGMNGITALGGVTIGEGRDPFSVTFDKPSSMKGDVDEVAAAGLRDDSKKVIMDPDFVATFEEGKWTVAWEWRGQEVCSEGKAVTFASPVDREAFNHEIESWIEEGILVKYEKEIHGDEVNFLPMFGIRQEKGTVSKVRPVFDFRAVNERVHSHPGGATPLCANRLREWRQMGRSCAVVDLRRAYLQVHIDKSLWKHQAVVWKGSTYLLTRLGFGLSSAPKIMTCIVESVISQDLCMKEAVSSYVDDLYVNTEKISVDKVRDHFRKWGLVTKEPEHLGCVRQVRVLGLSVDSNFTWKRDNDLPVVGEATLTRRQAHAILGSWVGHYPVCGWLRVVCSFIQRWTASDQIGWDDPVSDEIMSKLRQVALRLSEEGDPVKGNWNVDPVAPVKIWTDASSLSLGVAIEIGDDIVEDASWLRPKDDSKHINLAELDAVIRGVNVALRWGRRNIEIRCDSATVCGWLKALLEKTHNIKTSAMSEILIRRRLNTLKEIIDQEELEIQVVFVRSSENRADTLTRVPKSWLVQPKKDDTVVACCAGQFVSLADIQAIHDRCHMGVDRTLQLARERFGDEKVSKRTVRKVVSRCHTCARIDPATPRYVAGSISAPGIMQRWATDITHYEGKPYLTITDITSGFTIWRVLHSESGQEVVEKMRQIMADFGPPTSLLSDNGAVFRCREMRSLLENW